MNETLSRLDAYRRWGYLQARLDDLGRLAPRVHPDLADAAEDDAGRRWYCGPVGVEFMHLPLPDRTRWIRERMEADPLPADADWILGLLLRAELFERTLQKRYLGTKRFSLEGAVALLPFLAETVEAVAERGAEEVVLAMSHRGRLNVMTHIVGRDLSEILARFEDAAPRSVLGGGDVKFHLGAVGAFRCRSGKEVRISLVSNPSHLEAVDPVALGRTRAKQDRRGAGGRSAVVPVILHGDAAFAGQGVLSETLNLAELPAYAVGGTVHVLVNNLIGFTTPPESLHASRFASDAARRADIPIWHVNAEEPDAVVRTARMAAEYRSAFGSDVVVDLIGHRRHGHSEEDEPRLTQPLLYRKIDARPPLSETYAAKREAPAGRREEIAAEILRGLDDAFERVRSLEERPPLFTLPPYWKAYRGGRYDPAFEVDTAVAEGTLREVGRSLTSTPDGFSAHPKIIDGLARRREMTEGSRPVDWSTAEALAFGTLLRGGVRVRLTGQDTRRGTFNQRHAVLVDVETGAEHVPLAHVGSVQAPFETYDTPLSEAAPLGFEFGYSRDAPDALVLWEAQFGDFANGAQVQIDQFIGSAEDKWGLLSGLVLLLPHGYDGQGPEHSSARIERFLQTAAEDNLQVCHPSTAAQYFHLLRRQALRAWRKPLVIFTPKSMLRAPAAASPLADLATGRFRTVLEEPGDRPAERILLGSGKIIHELRRERDVRRRPGTAVIALEQLYPFPEGELRDCLERRPEAREIVWVQEEPANMGPLAFVRPRLERLAGGRPLRTVKRCASASPATGSKKAHDIEQAALMTLAFMGEGEEETRREP